MWRIICWIQDIVAGYWLGFIAVTFLLAIVEILLNKVNITGSSQENH